ncbi:MAG: hypothetical protein K6U10_02540 [Acidobacteriia bacterium]|nr:hypothetical protein [Methyloceanibacter sp.]MBX5472779.1 hypothetical protein [Acetobacteraceae bacterium]MCL6490680.1 hypothetical protein [Terriglobia bacterium]
MEFRLLFSGRVRPTANKGHPKETHEIRKAFHPQLRLLWDNRPNLRQLARSWTSRASDDEPPIEYNLKDEEARI